MSCCLLLTEPWRGRSTAWAVSCWGCLGPGYPGPGPFPLGREPWLISTDTRPISCPFCHDKHPGPWAAINVNWVNNSPQAARGLGRVSLIELIGLITRARAGPCELGLGCLSNDKQTTNKQQRTNKHEPWSLVPGPWSLVPGPWLAVLG